MKEETPPICERCKSANDYGIWVTRAKPSYFICNECYLDHCNELARKDRKRQQEEAEKEADNESNL